MKMTVVGLVAVLATFGASLISPEAREFLAIGLLAGIYTAQLNWL